MRTEPILVGVLLVAATATFALDQEPAGAAPVLDCCASAANGEARGNVFLLPPQETEAVTGKAHGRVRLKGEAPKVEPLKISELQAKGCVPEGEALDKRDLRLLVGPEGGIANAVISVSVEGDELRVPKEPVVLDQVQCRFDQHVLLVPKGCTLEYRNSDEVPHNVHTFSMRNKAFNSTLAAGGKKQVKVDEAETIQVKCDIHPWMSAYVVVSDTSFAAITDAKGHFSIPGLAPGEYTAKVWHESLGKQEAKITIGADGASEAVEVLLEPKASRRRRRR